MDSLLVVGLHLATGQLASFRSTAEHISSHYSLFGDDENEQKQGDTLQMNTQNYIR